MAPAHQGVVAVNNAPRRQMREAIAPLRRVRKGRALAIRKRNPTPAKVTAVVAVAVETRSVRPVAPAIAAISRADPVGKRSPVLAVGLAKQSRDRTSRLA